MERLFRRSVEIMRETVGRGGRVGLVLAATIAFGQAWAQQPFGISFQGAENGDADFRSVECTTLGDVLVTLDASDTTETFHFTFSANNYNLMFGHAPKLMCSRVANSQGLSWSHVGTHWALNLDHVQLSCQPDVDSNQPKATVLNLSGRLDCTHVIGSE